MQLARCTSRREQEAATSRADGSGRSPVEVGPILSRAYALACDFVVGEGDLDSLHGHPDRCPEIR